MWRELYDRLDAAEWLSLLMIAVGVVVFVTLLFVVAPYGRHARGGEQTLCFTRLSVDARIAGWGPMLAARWCWFLQETPNLYLSLPQLAFAQRPLPPSAALLLGAFSLHYAYRSLVYPWLFRGGAPMPLSVFFLSWLFCAVNGFVQGRYLTALSHAIPLSHPRLWIGLSLWAFGWMINVRSDWALIALRSPGAAKNGEEGWLRGGRLRSSARPSPPPPARSRYKIPRGGAFEWVSCANYAGEILEWAGWALAAWGLPPAAFAFFTFANLAPRAHVHHEWYKATFGAAYPAGRAAVIPFIW